jgi:hypothetical protein
MLVDLVWIGSDFSSIEAVANLSAHPMSETSSTEA